MNCRCDADSRRALATRRSFIAGFACAAVLPAAAPAEAAGPASADDIGWAYVTIAGRLISVSLGVWQPQSRAGVYAEASAIVYTLGQSRGVTAIAKIAGGLVLLRM